MSKWAAAIPRITSRGLPRSFRRSLTWSTSAPPTDSTPSAPPTPQRASYASIPPADTEDPTRDLGDPVYEDPELLKPQDGKLGDIILYMHHFDTYDIYTRLSDAGFSSEQADTIIDIIRQCLGTALMRCRDLNVSKTDWENEAYLFEAAESELRTEVKTHRATELSLYRSELNNLQRNEQILQDEMNEMLRNLQNEAEMEINDQKSSVNLQVKSLELRIQELDNKITNMVNGGIKRDVESLRWQTTRQGLMAIIFSASMLIAGTSYIKKEQEKREELERRKEEKVNLTGLQVDGDFISGGEATGF